MSDDGDCQLCLPQAAPLLALPWGEDFDWTAEARDGGSVVLREQRATAVYRNPAGDLVIRQERSWNEEEDPFVVITQQNEQEFLDKLCDVLGVKSYP